jgi:hypothetical protein
MSRKLAVAMALALLVPLTAFAKPKKKTYNNSPDQVFNAALRTARERHVVTYVDEKMLMLTFETGHSFTSNGFVANASVEPEGEGKATLIVNVQNKKGLSWGAGDRMADKFFDQVSEELSGETKQKTQVHTPEQHVATPEPKPAPPEPSMTAPAEGAAKPTVPPEVATAKAEVGSIDLISTPAGAEVYVDGAFIGNAPATLHLSVGKHTVKVSQSGYKDWSRDLTVLAGSEAHLNAGLEKQE